MLHKSRLLAIDIVDGVDFVAVTVSSCINCRLRTSSPRHPVKRQCRSAHTSGMRGTRYLLDKYSHIVFSPVPLPSIILSVFPVTFTTTLTLPIRRSVRIRFPIPQIAAYPLDYHFGAKGDDA